MIQNKTVGWIGLGTMGKPMAQNLMAQNFHLNLYNRSQNALKELVDKGAVSFSNPADLADASDIIFLSLPDSEAVESVVLGPKGLLGGLKESAVLIDTTSSSPSSTKKIAGLLKDKGVGMLDAPVSGGEAGAIQGTLSFMVGGPRSLFDACLSILEVLGSNIYYIGENGAGHTMKSINNLLYGSIFIASCEAVMLGVSSGIDPKVLVDVISKSSGQNHAVNVKFKNNVLNRNFKPGFTTALLEKDMAIALSMADDLKLPMKLSNEAYHSLLAGMDHGLRDQDHSALISLYEEFADILIRSSL